jgi:PII-like signaling protein
MTRQPMGVLKFYLSAGDRHEGRPLHEVIVAMAHDQALAGASVFRAELGLGHDHQVRDTQSEYAFTDPPLVVEVIDSLESLRASIDQFRPFAAQILITLSPTAMIHEESPEAMLTSPAQRLSIYLSSNDTWQGANLAVTIIEQTRNLGFAGATVTRGVIGFGKHAEIHRATLFHLSQELPEKVEIIDTRDRIAQLLATIEEMVRERLVLVEDVEIIGGGK